MCASLEARTGDEAADLVLQGKAKDVRELWSDGPNFGLPKDKAHAFTVVKPIAAKVDLMVRCVTSTHSPHQAFP